ncbi:MAG TPA: fumarate hydratase, partial [bacterium]|nr:fumarate hydratase [bacterium]
MPFVHQPLFELGPDDTPYRLVTTDGIETVEAGGRKLLRVAGTTLRELTFAAIRDVSHLLRPGHLQQLRDILDDPEASANDRFVALQLLKNANVAASMVLPSCQDTGTAIVIGKKGQDVWTDGDDEAAISEGVHRTFTETNLRYSQMAPLDMYREVNTGDNLPAQIELYAEPGDEYRLLYLTKGGGSANKTFLFQKTKALLNERDLLAWIDQETRKLGTAACPPYHLAIVVGGMSAEFNLKTVKLASARYLDTLPTAGNERGRAFRD